MINVHHMYNKGTTALSHGWAPHTVGPTPCERKNDRNTSLLQQVYNSPLI
jgi:hypothetical protein